MTAQTVGDPLRHQRFTNISNISLNHYFLLGFKSTYVIIDTSFGDRYLMTVKDVEWPDFKPKTEVEHCELPESVIEMFARAAQAVERNVPRAVLRGIYQCSGSKR